MEFIVLLTYLLVNGEVCFVYNREATRELLAFIHHISQQQGLSAMHLMLRSLAMKWCLLETPLQVQVGFIMEF